MSSPSAVTPSRRSAHLSPTRRQRLRIAGLFVSGSAVLPLFGVAASASALSSDATVFTHVAFSSDDNKESFWEDMYGPGLACTKNDSNNQGSSATLTQSYAYVIVKAGSGSSANTVFKAPTSGQVVFADTNGSNTADPGDKSISHIIYCTSVPTGTTSSTSSTSNTSTTSSTSSVPTTSTTSSTSSVPTTSTTSSTSSVPTTSTTSSTSSVPTTSTTSSTSSVPTTSTTSSTSSVPTTSTTDTSTVLPTSGSVTSTTASPTVSGVKLTSTTSSTTDTAVAGTTDSTTAPSASATVEGVKVSAGAAVSGGSLPRTGSDVTPLVGLSAMLLLAGATLLRLSGVRLQRTGRH